MKIRMNFEIIYIFFNWILFQPQPVKLSLGQKPQISPKPRLGDTIEMSLPPDLTTSGLQTWPLKHRVISKDTMKKNNDTINVNHHQYPSVKLSSNASTIDRQVALEEEKLINALKNGDVVNDNPPRHLVAGLRETERDVTVKYLFNFLNTTYFKTALYLLQVVSIIYIAVIFLKIFSSFVLFHKTLIILTI